jgi:ribose transport system ATP-binding protein
MSSHILEMTHITKSFAATLALDGVSLAVAAGEVHALVGENGAGKSTLMKVLSGAVAPDAGTMRLGGAPYRPRSPLEARRAGVAMIYQELSLAPHLSVEENILLGMEPATLGVVRRGEMRARALEALAVLEHAEIDPAAPVGRLSAAAQQLVEIARAVAVGCRVLVLDEPTSSLTQHDVERLFRLIARLKAQGQAIIYISHFIDEVQRIADRITVLRDGRVAGSGTAAMSLDAIVALMVGRNIAELYPRSVRAPGEAILTVDHLAGHGKPADAGFTLHRGEVLGIAGLVGAGRTELLRALFGLDPVRRGAVTLGAFSGPASPVRRWRQGMGLLSEDRKNEGLALGRDIADNLTLAHLPGGLVLPWRQEAAARRWIEALGIRCRGAAQRVGDLSGGNQQKVALARLLHSDVDVLLLDEPTRGIDVASKAQIYRLIDDLASGTDGRAPKAILIVSSYLPELLGICDRVAVMRRGVLGPAHPVAEVDAQALMREAVGG